MTYTVPRFGDLEVGAVVTKADLTVTLDDLVGASGDFHPVHFNDAVAASAGLPRRVPGVVVSGQDRLRHVAAGFRVARPSGLGRRLRWSGVAIRPAGTDFRATWNAANCVRMARRCSAEAGGACVRAVDASARRRDWTSRCAVWAGVSSGNSRPRVLDSVGEMPNQSIWLSLKATRRSGEVIDSVVGQVQPLLVPSRVRASAMSMPVQRSVSIPASTSRSQTDPMCPRRCPVAWLIPIRPRRAGIRSTN